MTTLDHALRLCELLEIDLARLADGEAWTSGLISDCTEHRLHLVTNLRFMRDRGMSPSVPASAVVHEVRDVDGVVVAVFKSTPSVRVSEKV